MSERIRSRVIFCEPKQRDVEIKYVEKGFWYSPQRKLKYCPASHDGGNSCDYSCLRKLEATAHNANTAPGRYGTGYYF